MTYKHITFLGGGNMAEAVLAGLLKTGHPTTKVTVCEVMDERARYVHHTYHVPVTADAASAASNADVLIIAVKPNHVEQVMRDVASQVEARNALVLSVAAGVRVDDISLWLGEHDGYKPRVVRCMPNTPALVGCGAAGVYAGAVVNQDGRDTVEEILKAVSKVVRWVDDENLLDAVTAVSGSGPAYFFLLMEAMSDAGVAAGLPRDVANQLTIQTCFGAAKMAELTSDSFAELRQKVTSPNGTTYAALQHMRAHNVPEVLKEAIVKAAERSKELGDEMRRNK